MIWGRLSQCPFSLRSEGSSETPLSWQGFRDAAEVRTPRAFARNLRLFRVDAAQPRLGRALSLSTRSPEDHMLQLLRSTWTVEFMAFAPRTPDWWTKDADSCAVRKTAMLRAAKPVPKRKIPLDATIPFLPFLRTAQERLPANRHSVPLARKR